MDCWDSMVGGDGDDTYYVTEFDDANGDTQRDVVVEANLTTSGIDTVITAIQGYALGTNIENLILQAGGLGTGNSMNNRMTGSDAKDYLDGRAGNDTVVAGGGDDIVWAGEGNDSVEGGDGNDALFGDSRNQSTTTGLGGNDTLRGGAGHDSLLGEDGDDLLFGDAGNDTLDGGAGTDSMTGGDGNDTHYVTEFDDANGDTHRDTIIESNLSTSGIDTVITAITVYALSSNIENLVLQAGGLGTGNLLGNQLTGTDAKDYLDGRAGNDTLLAGGGNDILWGGDGTDYLAGGSGNDELLGEGGNDSLYGEAGNDTLNGGTGNDTYYFQAGDGADLLMDNDITAGNSDKLIFSGAIASSQLWFRQVNANLDLEVSVIGTADKVTIKNWYVDDAQKVESFQAAGNNRSLASTKVDALVNAMASFTPPVTGQTTLPANYQTSLDSVMAANWA